MNYEVIMNEASGLRRERWRFWLNGTRVVLEDYMHETRPSKRHGFRHEASQRYSRLDKNNGTMPAHDVPQPRYVRQDVLRQIVADLQVVIRDRRDVEAPFAPEMGRVPFPKLTQDRLREECLAIIQRGEGFVPAAKLYREHVPEADLKRTMDTLRGWAGDPTATLANDRNRRA